MMSIATNSILEDFFQQSAARLQSMYDIYLQQIPALDLKIAMENSLQNTGKLIRPLLVYASSQIFNVPQENSDIPACAVELMHTYSLIHDDLPCMDNADLRRGKPTCHKLYGEALAVLTGDALQSLAMEIVVNHPSSLKPKQRMDMINILCHASGPFGMVAGQTLDINVMSDKSISLNLLENIYQLKTGALLSACLELGWLCSEDQDELHLQSLKRFGDNIGLAFQIQDDILDMETSTEQLGKTQGIDEKNNKITYPMLCGLAGSKDKVQTLYLEALDAINVFGHKANMLRELSGYLLRRVK